MNYNCFATCDPSSPGNNVVGSSSDASSGNINSCCDATITSAGYGANTETCSICKFNCIYLTVFTLIIVHAYK